MKCYHHLILLAVYTLIKRIIIKSEEMLRLYVDSESWELHNNHGWNVCCSKSSPWDEATAKTYLHPNAGCGWCSPFDRGCCCRGTWGALNQWELLLLITHLWVPSAPTQQPPLPSTTLVAEQGWKVLTMGTGRVNMLSSLSCGTGDKKGCLIFSGLVLFSSTGIWLQHHLRINYDLAVC